MQPARHISPCFRRVGASLGLALLAFVLVGCSSGDTNTHTSPPLLSGRRGSIAVAQLVPAARLARHFAFAYARAVYRLRPPRLPGTTAPVRRDVLAAASRVPPARRGLRPHALAVTLRPLGSGLAGMVRIGDAHSPPFSVGFLVQKQGSRWRVVTISPPS